MRYKLKVNDRRHQVDVEPDTPVLWVLREELGLIGPKYGCGIAQCGSCTVHVAGRPMRSCVLPIDRLDGREVTTIEGVSGDLADAVRGAWETLQVPQCGFCQAGQMMTTIALLESKPQPSDDDIDAALAGNLCRCATYPRIRRAVHDAAARAGGRR